jgi:hypothetical protein
MNNSKFLTNIKPPADQKVSLLKEKVEIRDKKGILILGFWLMVSDVLLGNT